MQVGRLLLGVVHSDERMQKLFEALCRDREALHYNDEKETSSGASKGLVEWERIGLKIEWM